MQSTFCSKVFLFQLHWQIRMDKICFLNCLTGCIKIQNLQPPILESSRHLIQGCRRLLRLTMSTAQQTLNSKGQWTLKMNAEQALCRRHTVKDFMWTWALNKTRCRWRNQSASSSWKNKCNLSLQTKFSNDLFFVLPCLGRSWRMATGRKT